MDRSAALRGWRAIRRTLRVRSNARLKRAPVAANAKAMSVTREEVAKIASLARISMDEDALDHMVPELNNILAWVEQLGEVDTSNVEPMAAVIPLEQRLRDDVVDADPKTAGGRREEVLANALAAEHGFFGVPKVIE